MTVYIFFTLCVITLASAAKVAEKTPCANRIVELPKEINLKRKLLCNYDPESRPRKNLGDSVDVQFILFPKYISAAREGASLTLLAWTGMIWVDDFLKWNTTEYKDIKSIMISSEKIWIPEIIQVNGRNTGSYRDHPIECEVNSSGQVSCFNHFNYKPTCETDYSSWPYDNQTCTVQLQTWFYEDRVINLTNIGAMKELYQPNMYWSIEKFEKQTLPVDADVLNETGETVCFSKVLYTIYLRRYSRVSSVTVIFPTAVMVTITLIALTMNAATFERIYLLAINLFYHLWYIVNSVSWTIPTGGSSSPVIILFLRDSIFINACLLMATVYQRKLTKKVHNVPKPIEFVVNLADTKTGKWLMYPGSKSIEILNNSTTVDVQAENKARWKKVEAITDRLLFLLTLFTYLGIVVTTMVGLL